MQFLTIDKNTTLTDVANVVGSRNVDTVLVTNSLTRSPDIGKKFANMCEGIRQGLLTSGSEIDKWIAGDRDMSLKDAVISDVAKVSKTVEDSYLIYQESAQATYEDILDGYIRLFDSVNSVFDWVSGQTAEVRQALFGTSTVPSDLNRNSIIVADKNISYKEALQEQLLNEPKNITPKRKMALLNTLTSDSEAYEKACLMTEDEWRVFATLNTFDTALKIPETIQLAPSANIIGNNETVSKRLYQQTMMDLQTTGEIDPVIFSNYSSRVHGQSQDNIGQVKSATDVFNAFNLPWGKIQLYSSLSDETIDFPVYPEELEYSRIANYTQMNETLFQYEPWYIYESSGPREQSLTFKFHRDMWSGDHRDGKANDLIRFCEANCYPEYDGAAVNTSTVTLYMNGTAFITGIMTNVTPKWSGPIGLDGWYLVCELSIMIAEVAASPLSYSTVRKMNIVGGYTT